MSKTWEGATALTTGEDSPQGLAADGVNVFFTTAQNQAGEKAVRMAPLQPADPPASRVLVAEPGGQIPDGPLAIDGGDLYVAAGAGIVKVSVATGATTTIVSGRPAFLTSLAVDSRSIWWTTGSYKYAVGAEVARMPKGGGPVEILAVRADSKGAVFGDDPARKVVVVPGGSAFSSIVPDGDTGGAYVASPEAVYRFAPGQPRQVVVDSKTLGGAPTNLALDHDNVYGEIAGGKYELFAASKGGGVPRELARRADSTAPIAVADGQVYFFDRGRLLAVPVTGGDAQVIASGNPPTTDLVVTGDRLVFTGDWRLWSAYRHHP